MEMQIVFGFVLDLLLGDPVWFPHPVRIIGKFITALENILRGAFAELLGLKAGGVVLTTATVVVTYGVARGSLEAVRIYAPVLYLVFSAVLIYFALAMRSLACEAEGVYKALEGNDLELAKKRLAGIVGRDTHNMDEEEIIKATVETVAENTSDGVVAPLFYIFLGGPAGGMAYKAASTLDSMVGYKNEKYAEFGWASAKLDDILNWIPARLTGYLLPLAGAVWGKDAKRGYEILRRDKRKHESPNAGYPEAAMAGTLGLRLGGRAIYGGRLVEKPYLGEADKAVERRDIKDAVRIMETTVFLALAFFYMIMFKLVGIV